MIDFLEGMGLRYVGIGLAMLGAALGVQIVRGLSERSHSRGWNEGWDAGFRVARNIPDPPPPEVRFRPRAPKKYPGKKRDDDALRVRDVNVTRLRDVESAAVS